MKRKNGFAISTIMYSILILFIVLLTSIMGTLATRKTLLDKSKKDVISFLNAQESTITANQESTYVEYKESNPLPGIYFDTEATNIECEIDGEIYTNTKSLELGEYELTCTIVYDDIRYASANTKLIVDTNNFEYTKDFIYSGTGEEWEVPVTGYYQIELWGAKGGSYSTAAGGLGAYSKGTLNMKANEIYYIYVGSAGATATSWGSNVHFEGGYNGGGAHGHSSASYFKNGGGGGTLIGLGATNPPTENSSPATQILAGTWSTWGGTFGQGFTGISDAIRGPGGGGGYYGGGGTGSSIISSGGGSSYISGYQGCIAIANKELENYPRTVRKDSIGNNCTVESAANDITCSYHYSDKIFTDTLMQAAINEGHGKAKITYIGNS